MWIQESFFKYASAIILSLLIILLFYKVSPIFLPLLWFIAAIFLPILFATLLYYILRPVVNIVERYGVPKYLSILLIYITFIILGVLFFYFFGAEILGEMRAISDISPEKIEYLKTFSNELIDKFKSKISIPSGPTVENILGSYLSKFNQFVYQQFVNLITTFMSIAVALALTPFVLFYFLRDDRLLSRFVMRFTPSEFQIEVQKVLQDIDTTLSNFIITQLTVAVIIGGVLFIGYLLIGLPQALSLALFAMIFYIIPALGTFIAIIPALIVGLSISFTMTIKVIIVMFTAHFLETNILTPRLMSNQLKIHPLTIVLLLLAAGSLYGLFGLLLVTPTYAIAKVVIWNLYKISRLRYVQAKNKND
jgi:predicted PurR-regulated permease PerM